MAVWEGADTALDRPLAGERGAIDRAREGEGKTMMDVGYAGDAFYRDPQPEGVLWDRLTDARRRTMEQWDIIAASRFSPPVDADDPTTYDPKFIAAVNQWIRCRDGLSEVDGLSGVAP